MNEVDRWRLARHMCGCQACAPNVPSFVRPCQVEQAYRVLGEPGSVEPWTPTHEITSATNEHDAVRSDVTAVLGGAS